MSATEGLRLAQRYSQVELLSLQAFIHGDPRSRNRQRNSIYIHSDKARQKLDAIAWAISYQLGLGMGRMTAEERIPVHGGFGYVEALPEKTFKTVDQFFARALHRAHAAGAMREAR